MTDESEIAVVIARDVIPELIRVLQTIPPEDRRKAVEATMVLLDDRPNSTSPGKNEREVTK